MHMQQVQTGSTVRRKSEITGAGRGMLKGIRDDEESMDRTLEQQQQQQTRETLDVEEQQSKAK